jgi:hypothetical protein
MRALRTWADRAPGAARRQICEELVATAPGSPPASPWLRYPGGSTQKRLVDVCLLHVILSYPRGNLII